MTQPSYSKAVITVSWYISLALIEFKVILPQTKNRNFNSPFSSHKKQLSFQDLTGHLTLILNHPER